MYSILSKSRRRPTPRPDQMRKTSFKIHYQKSTPLKCALFFKLGQNFKRSTKVWCQLVRIRTRLKLALNGLSIGRCRNRNIASGANSGCLCFQWLKIISILTAFKTSTIVKTIIKTWMYRMWIVELVLYWILSMGNIRWDFYCFIFYCVYWRVNT